MDSWQEVTTHSLNYQKYNTMELDLEILIYKNKLKNLNFLYSHLFNYN